MTQRLHHEHIVRINDPANAGAMWLTREQLWNGLHHTVVAPQSLDESIDSASINEVDAGRLKRCIRRGKASLSDEVTLAPPDFIRITVDDAGAFAGSTLTMRIEEPAPEMLFVRFTYEICGLGDARDADEDSARCSAYQDSDIERVRAARRYATCA